jgi:2,3-bisphosphoglycerate-dependent phosphoglycerate mutase
MMKLDNLSEMEVPLLELTTGIPIVYELDQSGQVIKQTILLN